MTKKKTMMDIGPTCLAGELPCGYLVDGKVHREFVVSEMTGEEEDVLAGKGPVVPRLNKVIFNCLQRLGEIEDRPELVKAVNHLTSADRMLMLIAIRRVSLGDDYDVKIACPSCSEESRAKIDLSGLEVKEMKEPEKREREDSLSTGKTVGWHTMNGKDETWLTAMQKKMSGRDVLTLAMLSRIDAIDDEKVDRHVKLKDALQALKKLSLRERNELRSLFTEHEGTIDTEVEYTCPECTHEYRGELDVGQPGFFFPQGM